MATKSKSNAASTIADATTRTVSISKSNSPTVNMTYEVTDEGGRHHDVSFTLAAVKAAYPAIPGAQWTNVLQAIADYGDTQAGFT